MKPIVKILLFSLFSIQVVFGWGKTGHRIVGEVAEKYLTKNAKLQIKKIMGHHDLSRMSNWADEIKSDPDWEKANDWHWCTIPDGEEYVKNNQVDILINNTQGPPAGNSLSKNIDSYQEAFDLLFKSVVHTTSLVIPGMQKNKWGRIINVTSVSVKEPLNYLVLSNNLYVASHQLFVQA